MSVTSLVIRLITIFQMRKFMTKIYVLFIQINNVLFVSENSSKIKKIQILFSIILLILFCLPAQLISIFWFSHKSAFVACLFTFNAYNNFSIACCEFQFVFVCYLLKQKFKIVNRKIDALNKSLKDLRHALLGKFINIFL